MFSCSENSHLLNIIICRVMIRLCRVHDVIYSMQANFIELSLLKSINSSIVIYVCVCFSSDLSFVSFCLIQNVSKSCLTIKTVWLAGTTLIIIRSIKINHNSGKRWNYLRVRTFFISAIQEKPHFVYLLSTQFIRRNKKIFEIKKMNLLLNLFLVDFYWRISFSILVWCSI